MQGPEVAAFEDELAPRWGASHAVAVSSGTAALELALRALGVGPGDEVITVSHSFIATANGVVAVGARPVFVDVERDTFGMDPALVAAAVSPQTKAILCGAPAGLPLRPRRHPGHRAPARRGGGRGRRLRPGQRAIDRGPLGAHRPARTA